MTLPLEGVRVVDFGWVWAGAVPGQLLADLGAEVIKIESHKRLDFMRRGRPIIGDKLDPEQNHMFHNVNRGKLGLTVDLNDPRGADLVRRLVARSDAAIENFAPGYLSRVGLDYAALREVNPSLVMISMSAAGGDGPLRDVRGYATIMAALAGIDYLVGYPGERPLGSQQAYADPNASLHAAVALMAALVHRQRTGEGQHIDLSQWETTIVTVAEAVMDYVMNGRVAAPQGNRYAGLAPCGNYPCRDADSWVSIAVGDEAQWAALVAAMGSPEWALGPEFRTAAGRLENLFALDRHLAAWTRGFGSAELVERLTRHGVPAAPLMDHEARYFDPHYRERETYVEIDHPILGREVVYNVPWRMNDVPRRITRRAPFLGEHNDYVCKEILGLTDEEVARLVAEEVLR
ncbi:MAG TPA: CoA transferase [Thermodesulfobacteriota bacterium]